MDLLTIPEKEVANSSAADTKIVDEDDIGILQSVMLLDDIELTDEELEGED